MFLFCVGSLLQCFRLRITVQIFRPDLGSLRSPPLLHLVAHLLINTNLLTLYASVYNRENILNSSLLWSKSSQSNPWYRLLCCSASYGFTQHFYFLVFETATFLVIFCKLWKCSDNTVSTDFLFFKCLFVTSHTLHFTMFTSTWFRFLLSLCF